MNGEWTVGEKGGPGGMSHTVIDSDGKIIAMMVPELNVARRIAAIPSLATITVSMGRIVLLVKGVCLVVEGDSIRDARIPGDRWTRDSIVEVAKILNGIESFADNKS